MKLAEFSLERYFGSYEFSVPHLMCCSDVEPLTMQELLEMGDAETLELWHHLKLAYTEAWGHPILRREISGIYKGLHEKDILVVVPEEGIFIFMNSLLEKGDHVITTFPGYQSLYQVAESIGCEVTHWLPEKKDTWVFDPEVFKSSLRPNTRLVVLNFPHNPTGAMLSEGDYREVIALAEQNGTLIFSDEMYRFLELNDRAPLPAGCELTDQAISLCGMSKSLALPGLRIGWLASRNKKILGNCSVFKDYTTICSSAPSEILALMGLRAKEEILRRNKNILTSNLKPLTEFFNAHSTLFRWFPPQGGSVAFPEYIGPGEGENFCARIRESHGILLLPGSVYNFEGDFFRIGFGRKDLPDILKKFSQHLQN